MGVIHKLKQEVVDFILQRKKEHPSLSCRQLSTMATERFQTTISKSSVNAVLKNARLSSSVGRRKGLSEKSFQIPDFKKQQISKSLKEAGFVQKRGGTEEPPIKLQEKDIKKEGQKNKKEDSIVSRVNSEPEIATTKNFQKKTKDNIEGTQKNKAGESLKKSEETIGQLASSSISLLKGMGLIFFKAAEWDSPGRSFFLKTFSRVFSSFSAYDVDKYWHPLLFLTGLGANTKEAFKKKQDGFFLQLDSKEEDEKIQGLLSALEHEAVSNEILFEYEALKKQLFLDVAYFKIFLEDGTILICDSKMRAFYEKEPVFQSFWPFYKAVSSLSRNLISNNDIFVSCFYMKDKNSLSNVCDIVSCLEKTQKKKIRKISLFNSTNCLIGSYSVVPEQKRSFVLGLLNAETAAGSFSIKEDIPSRRQHYCKSADKMVCFSQKKMEIATEDGSRPLRAIFLAKNKMDTAKAMLITNISYFADEDVVEGFLSRFPDFDHFECGNRSFRFSWETDKAHENNTGWPSQAEQENGYEQKALEKESLFPNMKGLLSDYFSATVLRCSGLFFSEKRAEYSINTFLAMLYAIKGSCKKDEDSLIVSLDLKEHGGYQELFEVASKQLNNSNIYDPFGYKIKIEIIK